MKPSTYIVRIGSRIQENWSSLNIRGSGNETDIVKELELTSMEAAWPDSRRTIWNGGYRCTQMLRAIRIWGRKQRYGGY